MTSDPPGAWEVIVVPFPHSERLAEKRRPAVVVSNAALDAAGAIWIAMITGAGKPRRPGDIDVADLRGAGLPGASMVRTSKRTVRGASARTSSRRRTVPERPHVASRSPA